MNGTGRQNYTCWREWREVTGDWKRDAGVESLTDPRFSMRSVIRELR
jgi:hypothetical protein